MRKPFARQLVRRSNLAYRQRIDHIERPHFCHSSQVICARKLQSE